MSTVPYALFHAKAIGGRKIKRQVVFIKFNLSFVSASIFVCRVES